MQHRGYYGAALLIARCCLPILGLYFAGLLTLAHLLHLVLPCSESSGCEIVALSPISTIFGVPLAAVGALSFAVLIGLGFMTCQANGTNVHAFTLGYALSTLCAVVGVGLTGYSLYGLKAACAWCICSCVVSCTTFLSYGLSASSGYQSEKSKLYRFLKFQTAFLSLVSFAAIGISARVIAFQIPTYNPIALGRVTPEQLEPSNAPRIGDRNPVIMLVFFGDLQCAACKDALPRIAKAVAASKKCGLVYRYYPLSLHYLSREAAVAAECSKQTVGFWPFVWKLYGRKEYLDAPYLRKVERWARVASVDEASRTAAIKLVDQDHEFAYRLGFRATPIVLEVRANKIRVLSVQAALDDVQQLR
jgi:protein-disulfide isomerase